MFQVLAHPQLHLLTLSHPGVVDLLLGLEPDQRRALLINPLPNHAGTVLAMAVSRAPFTLPAQGENVGYSASQVCIQVS